MQGQRDSRGSARPALDDAIRRLCRRRRGAVDPRRRAGPSLDAGRGRYDSGDVAVLQDPPTAPGPRAVTGNDRRTAAERLPGGGAADPRALDIIALRKQAAAAELSAREDHALVTCLLTGGR